MIDIKYSSVQDPRLNSNDIIPRIEDVFDRWICGSIKTLSQSEGVSLAFVVITCGIEYLAGFWKGGETGQAEYIAFLKAHPNFSAKYKPEDIYKSLRCGLVHNFTIHNGFYGLIHKHPEVHLKKAHSGQTMLNLENFFEDFKDLKRAVFEEAKINPEARKKFINRHRKIGFLISMPVAVKR